MREEREEAMKIMMNGRIHGLCTDMSRVRKQGTTVNHRRFGCLLLACFLLWALTGCGSGASAPEFPPAEEAVRTVAEEFGWTLEPEGTQSWAEGQILYALEAEDQTKVSVSCAMEGGERFLTQSCAVTLLPDKPQSAWEDWKEAVTLAETLFGGFSEGELYQALSEQEMPEPEIPPEGLDAPTGQESLSWEAELPAGYGRVWWSISAGTVEKNFPSPVIQDWRMTFSVSLYESKEACESMAVGSGNQR